MFRLFAKLLAALRDRASASFSGTLANERKGEFFSWLHLEPRHAPAPGDDGRTWHYFHPEGSNFQHLVRLDVLTAGDEIVAARLSLDRDFVEDRRNSPFARDIVKSFLAWSLRHESGRGAAEPLIANIASFGASGATVLMRSDATPPPPDTTGGYAAYLGRREEATLSFTRTRLTLRNAALTNGSSGHRWLTIDVVARVVADARPW